MTCIVSAFLWMLAMVGGAGYVVHRVGRVERNLAALVRHVQEMQS